MTDIKVYRYGHRPMRDKRVTTHVALTARAFGASGIIVDTGDEQLEKSIRKVVNDFGGDFSIETGVSLGKFLRDSKNRNLIHLTMYGIPIDQSIEKIDEFMSSGKNLVIFVGAEKVPGNVYAESTLNVSVTSQPISEISALAILLDRIMHGKEFSLKFPGKLRVVPMEKGKKVVFIPDRARCLDILRENNLPPESFERAVEIESISMRIATDIDCDRNLVSACSMLLPLVEYNHEFIKGLNDVSKTVADSVLRIENAIIHEDSRNGALSTEERIVVFSALTISGNQEEDQDHGADFFREFEIMDQEINGQNPDGIENGNRDI